MKIIRSLLILLLILGAGVLRGQSPQAEIRTTPAKAGGVYYVYTYDNPARTPAPKGYEPFYISHYGRHGSRYLLHNAEYTELKELFDRAAAAGALTPYGEDIRRRAERVYADGIDRAGDLTPLGAEQHRQIARRMWGEYGAMFRSNPRVEATSSTVVRCVLSMAAFSEGLRECDPSLRIDRASGVREMRYNNYLSKPTNPALAEEYLKMPESAEWTADAKRFYAERLHPERLLAALFTPGYDPGDGRKAMTLLWNAAVNMQDVDTGVTFDDLFTPEELYNLWECKNYDYYTFRGPSPKNRGYAEYYSTTLLKDFIARADVAVAGNGPAADLRFGHDGILMCFLNLLRIEGCTGATEDPARIADMWQDYRITPMAANIQLVFYRRKGSDEVLVKFLHNEREVRIGLPGGPYYRWNDVRSYYGGIMDSLTDPAKR